MNTNTKKVNPNFIFVTGGVVSSLGKGIAAASLGALLEARSYTVTIVKMDPYINVDPGTMSPYQHGEVFVTDDGAETDLDLGHYERFLNTRTNKNNSFTAGKVYDTVIKKERNGDYLGKTIQVIPHITDEIQHRILNAGKGFDFCIVEVGGTCGDIESLPFQEAIRQLSVNIGRSKSLFVHLTLLPYIKVADELKTKPTQHSVKELRSIGIQPDILICRSERHITKELKEKIALFTNVDSKAVFSSEDTDTIYRVPLLFANQKLDYWVINYFKLPHSTAKLQPWEDIVKRIDNPKEHIIIGIIGKYVGLSDAYKSVNEALFHAGIRSQIKVEIKYIDAEIVEANNTECLTNLDGILVPGGFGERGINGKLKTIQYARENNIPFLGICLGMQLAVIEYATNVLKLKQVNSTEWQKDCEHPIIAMVTEWLDSEGKINRRTKDSLIGGTMRLGSQEAYTVENSLARTIFGTKKIKERHRHRYEVNNNYIKQLSAAGLIISGFSVQEGLVEIIELPSDKHSWFLGCQFHPELKSTPRKGHPIFLSFTTAALNNQKSKT